MIIYIKYKSQKIHRGISLDPTIRLAASALPGEEKFILFAGAGVSKDAGIPTSWDLMLKTAALLYAAEGNTDTDDINLEEWFIDSKYAKNEIF